MHSADADVPQNSTRLNHGITGKLNWRAIPFDQPIIPWVA